MFAQFSFVCAVLCLSLSTAAPGNSGSSVITLTELRPPANSSSRSSTATVKRYYISTTRTDWFTARRACQGNGLQLLHLKTEPDQQNAEFYFYENDLANADNRVWLGLSDIRQEGTWVWDDGALLVWNVNWFTANNDLRDCASLTPPGFGSTRFTWDPMFCRDGVGNYVSLKFICETK